jgi:SAM-dependent methyltransferase
VTGSGGRPRAYPDIAAAWTRLEEFLGASFRPELTDYEACCAYVEEEFARLGAEDFYSQSTGYLYDLTHFHFMAHKDRFFDLVARLTRTQGLRDLGDVGCGVGLDAQALMADGNDVTAYDIPSPSLDYARWRLAADTGAGNVVRPLDALGDRRHDLVYAVDVLEHVPDPAALVPRLFESGRFVAVNLFPHDPEPWDGRDMHYPLDHTRLLPELARHGELVELAVAGETVSALWRGREEARS